MFKLHFLKTIKCYIILVVINMSETKKGLLITIISFALFLILVILLLTCDVKDIYDAKDVGLAGLNKLYCKEYNKVLDIISDILFYLIYAVVAKRLGQKVITFNDIKSFDIDVLNEEEINDVKVLVYQKYLKLQQLHKQ